MKYEIWKVTFTGMFDSKDELVDTRELVDAVDLRNAMNVNSAPGPDDEEFNHYYICEEGADISNGFPVEAEIAKRLTVKEICKLAGMSQNGMADYFGIPRRTFGNWCTGVNECPEYTKLMIQELLGLYRR